MYTFSSKLKTFSFILMALGVIGIAVGFLNAPKTIEDVEKLLADSHHHEASHSEKVAPHAADAHVVADTVKVAQIHSDSTHVGTNVVVDSTSKSSDTTMVTSAVVNDHNDNHDANADAHSHDDHKAHLEHVLHQLQNKPWAALYVACIFFMLISVGVLAFYAIQYAAQAGWSPILFRVMEGITSYLLPGSIIFFLLLVAAGLHFNHLFVWMDPAVLDKASVKYDKLIDLKSGYLNVPFFLGRAALFLIVWNLYRHFSRKNSIAQDNSTDNTFYKKNFKMSAAFLVFFIVSESIMSWDWIMSVDPHWYSTLFGWYVFASFFVSGITVIAMVTLYLKSKGYLEHVNTSHIHDLAKFMFGISIFWTYLWFSQFMLIWYSNIPEEVTYFVTRIEHYKLPFFGMLALNFIFPLLILINTDFKRLTWIVVMAGIVILFGHYIDFFNMIMPATVGDQWFIGIPEIGALMFFLGLFIFVVFTALTKAPLVPKGNPFIEESKHFHY
ncbi:quinol:cytochrome C oxidoreductase [Flavobacterium sp. HXWNR69]|uniref:Quinol:cytochrome C oxidoreductase n=1 Tax=Flavobacterium fragile TaxID=2949085 RepID=A0ABT0TE87_9FLAO|nr:quinol:cytochrome C oxidoreductase [Flavobacterium sp. HXWNR69]MCL9768931.1 quinol:cytochrome C oxidoreductase [Flavobacterium sp. HXWNR69]